MFEKWPDKDPDAVKDYSMNWATRLLVGETIVESNWYCDDPALIIGTAGQFVPIIDEALCTCWLSGGVVGTTYTVRNHIRTVRGMEDDLSATIRIRQQ